MCTDWTKIKNMKKKDKGMSEISIVLGTTNIL